MNQYFKRHHIPFHPTFQYYSKLYRYSGTTRCPTAVNYGTVPIPASVSTVVYPAVYSSTSMYLTIRYVPYYRYSNNIILNLVIHSPHSLVPFCNHSVSPLLYRTSTVVFPHYPYGTPSAARPSPILSHRYPFPAFPLTLRPHLTEVRYTVEPLIFVCSTGGKGSIPRL